MDTLDRKTNFKNMSMYFEDEGDLQSQGVRTSSVRQSGNIVPVPAGSLSDNGPLAGSVVSSAAELAIASTSGNLNARTEGVMDVAALMATVRQPEVRLTKVDARRIDPPPLPQRKQRRRQLRRKKSGCSPPLTEGVSNVVELSSSEGTGDEFSPSLSERERRGDRRPRGRPATTGEYVGLIKKKKKYIALKERELELKEIKRILDPRIPPKKTRAKENLPKVKDLREKMMEDLIADIDKGASKHLMFLEKVSDISKGLNGHLAHEMRVAIRNVEAAMAELEERSALQSTMKSANVYLRPKADRLEGEMDVMRAEISSIKASVSPLGRSPPHKMSRSGIASERSGVAMEVEWTRAPPSSSVIDPVFSQRVSTLVDKSCSPIWGADILVAPSSPGLGVRREVDSGESPLTRAGGISSAETSLMALLEAAVAEKEASCGEINRLREEFDSLSRDIASFAKGTCEAPNASMKGELIRKEGVRRRK